MFMHLLSLDFQFVDARADIISNISNNYDYIEANTIFTQKFSLLWLLTQSGISQN